MNVIKKMSLYVFLLLALCMPAFVPTLVSAQTEAALQCGADLRIQTEGCAASGAAAGTAIEDTIQTVINILSILVGVIAVIMIIIGGFKYITSNGDSSAVSSAKNTVIYAVVGLVVVSLAQIIVRFVVGRLTTAG